MKPAMKTLGLLGGMSWESTIPYYRRINEAVKARLGGLHSAKLLLVSVDFAEIEGLMRADQWEEAGEVLGRSAGLPPQVPRASRSAAPRLPC
jgi:aspartate racemase